MEKTKSQNNKGGEAPVQDGLSKKERRAIKVQANKSCVTSSVSIKRSGFVPADKRNDAIINSAPTNEQKKSQKTNGISEKTEVAKNVEDDQTHKKESNRNVGSGVNQVSEEDLKKAEEKERRRKEWEAKLKEQKKGGGSDKEGLNKAELKAKRREQQEAQRQSKAAAKVVPVTLVGEKAKPKTETVKPAVKKQVIKTSPVSKVQLVHHLYSNDTKMYDDESCGASIRGVHPAFRKLGVQYAANVILGSNARCFALLAALKELIDDLSTPPKQEFCRYLESTLQHCVAYLQHCRPFAVSMTNALRHFKLHITQVDTNLSDNEKKAKLIDVVDTYFHDDISKAGEAISMKVNEKICNGDVILTYGCSSLIKRILLDGHENGKKFEVIIVDGRPLCEGKEMLRRLTEVGIPCKYVIINAVSNVMRSASKVLLGAHALLANGYVMSRTGTTQVAMIAKACNKPVLVCCETYKFSEKVQTDSFVYNELGNTDKLLSIDTKEESSPLANLKNNNYLTFLNLLYDVTPSDFVTAVVTELGFLPCTSVPVVLRIRPAELS